MARDEGYLEAERRIEEARQAGATELDLRDLKLTEVPESIGQLTNLQKLDLGGDWDDSKNQLTELPEVIASLTLLESINLSNNLLTKLPNSLVYLLKLKEIDCGNNLLKQFPPVLRGLKGLRTLLVYRNQIEMLPSWISELSLLEMLSIGGNQILEIPKSLGTIQCLRFLILGADDGGNPLIEFPRCIRQLNQIQKIWACNCELKTLPDWLNKLPELQELLLHNNLLTDLPSALGQIPNLKSFEVVDNPLNPDLAAANEQGIQAIMQYLRAKADGAVTLNEAKLILVGEGEVGKSCLLGALRGDPWVDGRPTTHGIEIKPVIVTAPDSITKITLNGWDFGGQRVYRPTHQLFFSAPAVYLVVWKPREGPQQGFVKEWITLIKHREPDAKVLVVATHGGPGQRQPDIDRQELIDLFGSDTVVDFFHVDSKPNAENQYCYGIAELREAISNIAAALPGMGRTVPTKWQHIREILEASGKTHLPYSEVIAICEEQGLEGFAAELFIRVSHTLGYLIHYHYDTTLKDFVILKPDWLAKAISFVLDDDTTRRRNGLVEFTHLSQLWSHPPFEGETGYPKELHPVFLRLMERFDLSYKVVLDPSQPIPTSLIAQLVLDNRPDRLPNWEDQPETGDLQKVQICRIVDDRGQFANAEGLFYQLIVRLHKYSLGRTNYENSVHWQKGLMLDDDYNGRALLEYSGSEVKITVRAAYPEFFLYELTKDVKWLIEHFWEGLRCEVMVPCVEPCGKNQAGLGLFDVQKLKESKRQGMPKFPCMVSGCNKWLDIDELMRNAPNSRQNSVENLLIEKFGNVNAKLENLRTDIRTLDSREHQRFQKLNENDRRLLSQGDEQFAILMQMLTDEAKDGPRLFSFMPVDPKFFDRPKWLSAKFQITLWCEHSRQPLPVLNPAGSKQGIYELDLPREWLIKAAPLLKTMSVTLSLILPVASSATKFMLDETTYKGIEEQLDLGQKSLESVVKTSDIATTWQSKADKNKLEHGEAIRAEGAMLRSLHALLKQQDPSFGGLIQVQNKRREFLWVHPQFVNEY